MKRYLWLLPFLFIACEKFDQNKQVDVRQQPSQIVLYSKVASNTYIQTSSVVIYYNDSTTRFDSISFSSPVSKTFRFDYSFLNTQNKLMLYDTDTASDHFNEIVVDPFKFSLNSYKQYNGSTLLATGSLSYNDSAQVTGYNLSSLTSSSNFTQSYRYRLDTVFIETTRPFSSCFNIDTLINSRFVVSNKISWLLLAQVPGFTECGITMQDIVTSLSLSNYSFRLPSKILSGNMQITYNYVADSKSRLSEVNVVKINLDTNVREEIKVKFFY